MASSVEGPWEGTAAAVTGHDLSEPSTPDAQVNYPTSEVLPVDDGQRALRQRIAKIWDLDVPNAERGRLMHEIMNERYRQAQECAQPSRTRLRSNSPASAKSQEAPVTTKLAMIGAVDVDQRPLSPMSCASRLDSDNAYNLTPDDLIPTYVPITTPVSGAAATDADGSETDPDDREPHWLLGCQHYKRNVKLQCSTCHRWYTCRFCHDEAEDHPLIRRETKNMLCMLCLCAQPAGELCAGCGGRTAWYYCGICKLWDNDSEKNIYHCNDCGICRVGRGLGKDFFHCKTCCVCMSISITSHKCIERSTDCDCPICGEYMFTSPETVVFMQCGHSIHHKCYYEHMKTSYRCPICSRSVVNMETQFRNLDRAIESQPMPAQFRDTRALVYCSDCCSKSSVKYHWLGLKCGLCDSYNTAQIRILAVPESEAGLSLRPSTQRPAESEMSSSLPIGALAALPDSIPQPNGEHLPHHLTSSMPPDGTADPTRTSQRDHEHYQHHQYPTPSSMNISSAPTGAEEPPTTITTTTSSPSSSSHPTILLNDPDHSMDVISFWGGDDITMTNPPSAPAPPPSAHQQPNENNNNNNEGGRQRTEAETEDFDLLDDDDVDDDEETDWSIDGETEDDEDHQHPGDLYDDDDDDDDDDDGEEDDDDDDDDVEDAIELYGHR